MNTLQSLLTIAICTKNRPLLIQKSLSAILAQKEVSFEQYKVLIIDSSTNRYTHRFIQRFIQKNPTLDVVYYHCSLSSISGSRNLAIKYTSTRYLSFIDDDVIPRRNWLKSIFKYISKNTQTSILFGTIYPKPIVGQTFSPLIKRVLLISPWILSGNIPLLDDPYPLTANVVINMDVFRKVGWFNLALGNLHYHHFHPFGEDVELFQRAKEAEIKSVYLPEMSVDHLINSDRFKVQYILKRYYDDGQNKLLFMYFSKRSIPNFYKYAVHTLHLFPQLLKDVRKSYPLGIVYFIFEVLGWFKMSFLLILHNKYYRNRYDHQIIHE